MGKPLKAQTWFVVGLVAILAGFIDLMKHGIPHWPALVCFAATALLFWVGDRTRRQNRQRENEQQGQ